MPSGFDKTRITKTSIPTVRATKGDDIWTRVKTKAAESAVIAASSLASNGFSLHDNLREQQQQHQYSQLESEQQGQQGQNFQSSLPAGVESYPFKEFGANGEIIIVYEHVVEIWDWSPSPIDPGLAESAVEDTLYLVSCTDAFDGSIELVSPFRCDLERNEFTLLVGVKVANDHYFQVVELKQTLKEVRTKIILPPSTIGSAPYHCKVLQDKFILITSEGSMSIFDKKDYTPVGDLDIFCKLNNNVPVCDVQGDWLIYNPSFQDSFYKEIVLGSESYPITPLNLPKPGPLLNRVLKNLSSTAIDSVFKIAEISHSKLKSYMNQNNDDELTKSRNLRDTITKILNALNETSSKQFLILVSLQTKKPLFAFSPPGGCSMISLSPHDLLLTSVTLRGDDIFIWDFTKFNREISLIEKFKRGKMPGIIDQIIWGNRDRYIGVLSRLSGSLHWFQNNFLNEYEESDNWTMSSFGLKKLKLVDDSKILSIDNKNNLKVVNTKGFCKTLYVLPQNPIPLNLLPNYLVKNKTQVPEIPVPKPEQTSNDSKLELDYTLPYEFYYTNRKVEFYSKKSDSLDDWIFGKNDQNLTKINFGRANGVAVFHDNKDSINVLLNERMND